jgi:hypothetical protein
MEEKRPMRRQPEDHHFSSLIMLAVTARRLPAGHMGSNEGALFLPQRRSDPLKTEWQRHVLASSGYLELGMFDAAALVLEEIAPEDKTRTQVLRARVVLYMAAKKWDMAATIASQLVKVESENETLEGATALLIARNSRSLFSVNLFADALAPKFRNRS